MAENDILDLFVIGGGINGAGIARDAAGRGLKVGLADAGDFAGATSSASSKLLHGGLRYLETFDFAQVRKGLRERELLLHAAPHLARPLRLVLPLVAGGRPGWLIRAGLALYDNLAHRQTLPGRERVDLDSSPLGMALKSTFTRGFAFSDAQVDDARLVLVNLRGVADLRGRLWPRHRVLDARRRDGLWLIRLEDRVAGIETEIAARALVNAAGPWAAEVGTAIGQPTPALRLVKGAHIVVPRLYDGDHGYLLQNNDGRVVFVLPFEDRFQLIGTTESDLDGPPHGPVTCTMDDITYLCRAVGRFLGPPVRPRDVVWHFAGVRPLVADQRDSASRTTRGARLTLDALPSAHAHGRAPLITVLGGKLTTYRALAEQAVNLLRPFFPGVGPAWTGYAALPGGDLPKGSVAAFAARLAEARPELPADWLTGLVRRHGTRAPAVLGDAVTPADLGWHFGGGLYQREVDHFVHEEWARTADDVLWRRTRLGLEMRAADHAVLADYLGA